MTETTLENNASANGKHSPSARTIGSRLRACRSIPTDRSMPMGDQPRLRIRAACVPVPHPISRDGPAPWPSILVREPSTPMGSVFGSPLSDRSLRNSPSYQSAISSYGADMSSPLALSRPSKANEPWACSRFSARTLRRPDGVTPYIAAGIGSGGLTVSGSKASRVSGCRYP